MAEHFILSTRYGREIRSPSDEQLAAALEELYVENEPSMTEADYEEHGAAWLRGGTDGGSMYVLYVTRHGRVTLELWADWDYEQELQQPLIIGRVEREQALALWRQLSGGDYEAVKNRTRSLASANSDA